jgi:uncharacterized protein with PIN domain
MTQCPACGGELKRTHRKVFQRMLYSDAYVCRKCGYRTARFHPFIRVNATFVFSRYTHCIRCGTARVHRMAKRDRIDSMSRHVLSLVQHLAFAPVNKCTACRLQYYDWRPPKPSD